MNSTRILIVDDEPDVCELLTLYFKHKGLEATAAQTELQARVLVEQTRFDLVVADWNLGGTEGLDFLYFIKARHPDVPVIVFTGADVPESILGQAVAGWADAVVRKMGSLEALWTEAHRQLAIARFAA